MNMMHLHDNSMTPPLSPVTQMEVEEDTELDDIMKALPLEGDDHFEHGQDNLTTFTCLGALASSKPMKTHKDGYLQKGEMVRLLNGSQGIQEHLQDTHLGWKQFFADPMLLAENMAQPFYTLRTKIFSLEQAAETMVCKEKRQGDLDGLQADVRILFELIKKSIQNFNDAAQNWIPSLLHHIKSLLLFLGRLYEVSLPQIIHSGIMAKGAVHQLFHLHLDLHWNIIEVLHVLSLKYPDYLSDIYFYDVSLGDNIGGVDLFMQCVQLLLWDIVVIAIEKHNKTSLKDLGKLSVFPCSCVKELVIMLIQLTGHRQQKLAKESFWVILSPILQDVLMSKSSSKLEKIDTEQEIASDMFSYPPVYDSKDPVGFCWWFLSQVAPLYLYDTSGNPVSSNKHVNQSNYFILREIIKTTLAKTDSTTEATMRFYLKSCCCICEIWEPNTGILTQLWDFFFRRLNEHFNVPSLGTAGFITTSGFTSGLLGDDKSIDQENSFHLFLRILKIQLLKAKLSGSNTEWKQLKGRFYSKFHQRRMQELSEVGLSNLTSLFLTLAQVTDMEDVSNKLCDLYGMLAPDQLDSTRHLAIWKGMFALVLLHLQRNVDIGFLADKLVKNFDSVCSEYSQKSIDSMDRHNLWKLIAFYTEQLQDVIETSENLCLGEHKLIGLGYKLILSECRENDMRCVLNCVQTIMTKQRILYKRAKQDGDVNFNNLVLQYRNLSDKLWVTFYEFVRQHSITQTPPSQVADVAAGFTLLVMELPPSIHSGMKEDFLNCFQYFAWSDSVNKNIVCRYICHLLPNHGIMEQLVKHHPEIISTWFQCCWQIHGMDDEMKELTRLVLKLPEMKQLFQESNIEAGETFDRVVLQFIQALGATYSGLQGLKERINFQEKTKVYYKDVMKCVTQVVKEYGPPEAMKRIYFLAGHLVKHCAQFLYIKSRPDCLLPGLIEKLVLPRILLNPNKQTPVSLLPNIRDHLHLFVQGLYKLDYKRDPYVQRKLKDIIIQYTVRFQVKNTSNSQHVHPLLVALNESFCGKVQPEAVAFRQYFLDILKKEFMTIKGNGIPDHAQVGFRYLIEIMQKTLSQAVIARDCALLFPLTLDYMLVCENVTVKQQAALVLQSLIEASKMHPEIATKESLMRTISSFLELNVRIYEGRTMKVLETVSILYPQLLADSIPSMTKVVKDSEQKRGVGIDKQLRLSYCNLLNNLGEKGQEEKSKLLLES